TYFMAASKAYNVIVSSAKGNYYIYTYDSSNGDLVWKKEQSWFSDNHGGHLSHPSIVKNKLVVKPAIYELDSGKKLKIEIPKAGHGCASYTLSEQSVFYRGGSVTQFNFDTDNFSKWERLRPDCWISTIPAQGMILSPEAGGGCSCGNWLETSMVFAPISRAPLSLIFKDTHFIDSLSIEVKARDVSNKNIYYTLDGSEPSKDSKHYIGPIIISNNTTLNTIIYVEKDGKEIAFTRTKEFTRLFPEPSIAKYPQLLDGNWVFFINLTGKTGEIRYTTDGTTPDINSPIYDKPVPFSEKILIKAKTFWAINGHEMMSKETSAEQVIPKLLESVSAEVESGIIRKYYKVIYRDMPDFSTIEPDSQELVTKVNLERIKDEGKFALHFKGYLQIERDGMYTIFNQSIGESYVYLHDNKIITSENDSEQNIVLALKKGLHPIIVNYKIWRGNPKLTLQIEGPNLLKQIIDNSMLKH
ncbi:MAG: chitobiase/beta-hexosaminidase C-terminal domain-containing protein, partial [Bacteroidales bacterium]|nr:chitobiase/beta-hexosaminidase C-terminal domain-containing protein [Bacteroidales bacterium]